MGIAGASRFLNSSILANTQGLAAQTNSVLNEAAGGISLLDAGRRINRSGLGISVESRQRIDRLIEGNSSTFNTLFSLSGGGSSTVEASLAQIAALQSSTPVSRNSLGVIAARGGDAAAVAADIQAEAEANAEPIEAADDIAALEPGSLLDETV